ncbi:MAG TPA: class IV adenylate cyclase [Candidatus Omnitrophota bacterium]|nr:class IV adenylate cyclase [Candidatus Omnitrophota bacterium]HPS36923.1 class IV adenylate cyclase [Candidatus Omnitrophota bacterium]
MRTCGGISIEIKARCSDPFRVRQILKSRQADFKGLDRQRDTYFRVPSGRLKLREGRIENALIYYKRTDQKNSKKCDSVLWKSPVPRGPGGSEGLSPLRSLKKILEAAAGVLAVVDKRREIYFIRNVKFHIDRVKNLGDFVEIEVFGRSGKKNETVLRKQCEFFQKLLGIEKKDLLADSYSDQLLRL